MTESRSKGDTGGSADEHYPYVKDLLYGEDFNQFFMEMVQEMATIFTNGNSVGSKYPYNVEARMWMQALMNCAIGLYRARNEGRRQGFAASFLDTDGARHSVVWMPNEMVMVDERGMKCGLASAMMDTHQSVFQYMDNTLRDRARNDPELAARLKHAGWDLEVLGETGVMGKC